MEYKPSFLIFSEDLGQFFSDTIQYKKSAIELKKIHQNQSFHLFCSLVFELFPKVLLGYEIIKKHKNENDKEKIRNEIFSKFRESGHNIKALFENFPDLLIFLNIKKIIRFDNGNVSEYRFELKNNKYIAIKDIEAIRYGQFSKKKNKVTDYSGDDYLIILLNKIIKYINIEKIKTTRYLLNKTI